MKKDTNKRKWEKEIDLFFGHNTHFEGNKLMIGPVDWILTKKLKDLIRSLLSRQQKEIREEIMDWVMGNTHRARRPVIVSPDGDNDLIEEEVVSYDRLVELLYTPKQR